jgi:hypothetical protein
MLHDVVTSTQQAERGLSMLRTRQDLPGHVRKPLDELSRHIAALLLCEADPDSMPVSYEESFTAVLADAMSLIQAVDQD